MKRLILLASIVMISGCALTTAKIDIPYQSASVAAQVGGANGAVADVRAVDARATYRDRVGSKKNGYGMEMAAIVSSKDVPTMVGDAFRQELVARGFKIGADGADVQIELVRFYNDFKNGFFSGDAVATAAFNVKVTRPNGTVAFTKYYEGTGTEPNIQLAGGDNARAALTKAFTNGVNSAVSDVTFLQAVMSAGTGPRPDQMRGRAGS